MGRRDHIEVDSKNTTDHCCRRQATGYYGHYFHYLIHSEIYIINIEVLHAYHYIAIIFAEVMSLDNMVMYIFKIFGGAVFKQFAFAADNTTNKITNRNNIPF